MTKEEREYEKSAKMAHHKDRLLSSKARKLDQDVNEYHYKVNQANRTVIKKIISHRKNEIIEKQREAVEKTKKWIGLAVVQKIASIISKRMKHIIAA